LFSAELKKHVIFKEAAGKKGPGSNYFWQKGKTSKHPFPKINVVCPLFGRYFPETIIHYFCKNMKVAYKFAKSTGIK
jgi:hypothetical protein